ncbi:hypothetical protein UFOVP1204_17 [uncultured Caudovirales phage]|uniref:Uncharacterized protein n=1 Tax=uncultured Caudovirales phage TaxID=2100421 RepID=A0A6J5MFU4_9CAUD|nr:hypothetical protein UFOVP473_10 [uncultured Caudovirales phage]CAB4176236.1 hypothetical protein UFOVP983_10 [uncultured Caudovirales phage]CAB4189635.1 hypothetical protein UFOVP1204_17 [uncultured Caudovirales phage]
MTVSGTISTTVYNTGRVIDTAFRRCRVPSQEITGEMIQIAKDNLYLILSSLPQIGMQLWAVDKLVVAFEIGKAQYTLPVGTVDLADKDACTLRQTDYYSGTDATYQGGIKRDFGAGKTQCITTAGVVFATGGTYALVFQFTNDGVTYTTNATVPEATYEADQLYWFDLDPTQQARYFVVKDATSTAMDIDSFYTTGNPRETPMSRQSQYDYLAQPNKTMQGRPIQIWFNRQREAPVIYVWPTPNASYSTNQMVVSRKRQIMDVGTLAETLDIPQRWYNSIISSLAYNLSCECPIVKPEMMPALKMRRDEELSLAQFEERDDSPIKMYPAIRGYTR